MDGQTTCESRWAERPFNPAFTPDLLSVIFKGCIVLFIFLLIFDNRDQTNNCMLAREALRLLSCTPAQYSVVS